MAGFADLSSCIARYNTDSAGIVANQLVDQSGFGNNLDLITGTPLISTKDGIEMVEWNNTFYFEGDCPLVAGGSCVVVGCVSLAGTEGGMSVVATAVKKANAGNYDARPNDATVAEFLGSTTRINQILANANRTWSFFCTSANAAGSAWTNDAANLFTAAVRGNPAAYQASTGTQSTVSATIASAFAATASGGVMRIGMLNTSFGVSPFGVNRYVATKRIYFFNENVFNNASYTTKRDEEIALWGI